MRVQNVGRDLAASQSVSASQFRSQGVSYQADGRLVVIDEQLVSASGMQRSELPKTTFASGFGAYTASERRPYSMRSR